MWATSHNFWGFCSETKKVLLLRLGRTFWYRQNLLVLLWALRACEESFFVLAIIRHVFIEMENSLPARLRSLNPLSLSVRKIAERSQVTAGFERLYNRLLVLCCQLVKCSAVVDLQSGETWTCPGTRTILRRSSRSKRQTLDRFP